MKKNILMTAIAAVTLTAGAAFASSSSSNYEPKKIGVVNVKKAFQDSKQAQHAKKTLKSKMQGEQKDLKKEQQQVQKLMKKLKRNKSTMSKDKKQKLQKQIQQKQQDLQQKSQKFQQEAQKERSKAMQDIVDAIEKSTKKVAEQKNLDLVLSNTATVYSDNSLNITDEVESTMKKMKS